MSGPKSRPRTQAAEEFFMPYSPLQAELEEYREMIAEAAYVKAEQRGFKGGHELEDWLAAEKEISEFLAKS